MSEADIQREYGRGNRLFRQGKHQQALQVYLALAESQPPDGPLYTRIAFMYRNGLGVPLDAAEADRWLERATETGYPRAFLHLAASRRVGGQINEERALLEVAASQGYFPALYYLGCKYFLGSGVEKDEQRALDYFRRAAAEGHVFAQRRLAGALIRGVVGIHQIPRGVVMFAQALYRGIRIHLADAEDDRIQ